MLCLMFDCEKRGVLATGDSAWSPKEIANVVSGDTNLVVSHIEELLQKRVARMDDLSGSQTGIASAIYSGRMLRDEKERQRWRDSKNNSRHGHDSELSRDCPGNVPVIVPEMSRPSSLALSLKEQKPIAPSDKETIAQEPHVLAFPALSGDYALPVTLYDAFVTAYPGIDAMAELHKAKAWLIANPTRQKTERGMSRFLNTWLAKAQNSGRITGKTMPPESRYS